MTKDPEVQLSGRPAPAQPLALWRVLIYGMGWFGGLAVPGMNSLSLNVFNILMGVDAVLITSAMGMVQVAGIFMDPIVANFSDNLVTRWGRRRPLIVLGSVIAGLMFALMWMFPPGWTGHQYFVWYLILSLVLNLGNSLYGSAYYALGIEIATDYKDRTRIMAVRSYFSTIGALITPWLFFLAQIGIFASALQGMRWIGAMVGGLIIATAIPCAVLTRERFDALARKERAPHRSPWDPVAGFFKTIIQIGNNRYFWMVLSVAITVSTGLAIFEAFGNYVVIYYVFHGDVKMGAQFSGWGNTIGVTIAILAIPMAQALCNRLGKHVTLRLALGWMFIGSVLKWWCYNPSHPFLIFVIPFFYSLGISSFWMIIPAMQADVVDIDELHSGKRREAMFGAVQSIGFRASSAIAITLMGFLLNASGFVRDLGGNQTPETFFRLRFMYSFAMGCVILLSLLFLWKYDLTAKKMAEVSRELERRRRGVVAESA